MEIRCVIMCMILIHFEYKWLLKEQHDSVIRQGLCQRHFAKDTKLLNIPQQIKNFPKQRWNMKTSELTYKTMGSYAWAWEMDQKNTD